MNDKQIESNSSQDQSIVPTFPLNLERKSNNKFGRNGITNSERVSLTPYTIRYLHAQSLIDEGKTYNQIRMATGLCNQTISSLKKGRIKLATHYVDAIKKNESKKLTFLSNSILDAISVDDLTKASLLQKTTAASQLIDKRRLIDGESTENISLNSTMKNLSDYSARIADKLKELD